MAPFAADWDENGTRPDAELALKMGKDRPAIVVALMIQHNTTRAALFGANVGEVKTIFRICVARQLFDLTGGLLR